MAPRKRHFSSIDLGTRRASARLSSSRQEIVQDEQAEVINLGQSQQVLASEPSSVIEQISTTLDDRPNRLAYTSDGLSPSDKRAALTARSKPYTSITRFSRSDATVTEAADTQGDVRKYAFSVNSQQVVELSADGELTCPCPRPSRTSICEHIWAVQETLVEYGEHGFDPRRVMWKFTPSPATVQAIPLRATEGRDPASDVGLPVPQLRQGRSMSLYELFDTQAESIARRGSWVDFSGDEEDEQEQQALTSQILALCSPGLVLPGETLEANIGDPAEKRHAKLSDIILAVARSDTRIHVVIQSMLEIEQTQQLLVERVETRLDSAVQALNAAADPIRPASTPYERTKQTFDAIEAWLATCIGAVKLHPRIQRRLCRAVLEAATRTLEHGARPAARVVSRNDPASTVSDSRASSAILVKSFSKAVAIVETLDEGWDDTTDRVAAATIEAGFALDLHDVTTDLQALAARRQSVRRAL